MTPFSFEVDQYLVRTSYLFQRLRIAYDGGHVLAGDEDMNQQEKVRHVYKWDSSPMIERTTVLGLIYMSSHRHIYELLNTPISIPKIWLTRAVLRLTSER